MRTTNTCNFSGRIGNNLFQLANLISFSIKNKSDWIIPSNSIFWVDKERTAYRIPFEIFSYNFGNHITKRQRNFYFYDPKVFNFKKHPIWLKFINIRFNGHYLSYKFFHDIRYELIDNYFSASVEIEKKINDFDIHPNSTAISVRRGDFLKLQDQHTVLDICYYENAIQFLESIYGKQEKIYVFSDDLDWCKKSFVGDQYVFINGDLGEQFFLMTRMKRIVLSNSSFAWWGAYLNRQCEKIVYPGDWFGPQYKEKFSLDLFPPNWQIMY
jgi:hypothetical protein